jgi:hypothetical protein
MKTIIPAILFAALIGVSTLWAQNSQTDQKTIKQLEARFQALEARVTALEKIKETKCVTLPSSQLPPASKPDPRWRPFEFNGQTYYAIPLKQGEMSKK